VEDKTESPTLRIEHADSYEILTSTYKNTQRHSLENHILKTAFTNLLQIKISKYTPKR
jgi:hypothetical protein